MLYEGDEKMSDVKKERFVRTLTSAYNQSEYVLFLKELLTDMKEIAPDKDIEPFHTFAAAVARYNHIGTYMGGDDRKVALFSVCLRDDKNLENARSMQRNFVKSLLESSDCAGALVSFYTAEDPSKWRLSFVRMDYEFSKGKINKKLTPAKRYSYLVGKGEPSHTAQERLYPIFADDNRNPGLDELEDAFSVEAVTKEFFDRYKDKYLDLKDSLDGNPQFVAEAESRGFDSEQFAKKLMGQIVFLYFIQKKGWLGVNSFPFALTEKQYKDAFYRPGQKPKELMQKVYKQSSDGRYIRDTEALLALSDADETELSKLVKGDSWGDGPKDFMRQIFNGCEESEKNFFDDYLEPLFYTGLNQKRDNDFFPPLHRKIPFLNGGLFEEMDGYDWKNNDFSIPNDIFSNSKDKGRDADGILDVFDRYNFTMAEDEPMEREVAIDPEMLGKVFENLLDVSDRKSKGAFYTPREIVHYMCQETLIRYLSDKTGIDEGDIRKFILLSDYFRDEDIKKTKFIKGEDGAKGHYEFDYDKDMEIPESILSYKKNINRLGEIDNLLASIKVVDLAVGSGAFPLGMLNEIVKARDIITTYMTIEMNGRQRLDCHVSRSLYNLKRITIKNCIFACDIEASATDITKLRLWLSLVIDNQIMKEENLELGYSTKPRELPNLECNVICGNSLVDEFMGTKLFTENYALNNVSDGRQGELIDQSLEYLINELIDLQSKLYDEKDHAEKASINDRIQEIYNKIVLEQIQFNTTLVDEYYKATQMPSQPFVLWPLYFPKVFRDNGGFDVVIGNPPYVSTKGQSVEDKKVLERIYGYADDLYYHFIDQSFRVSRKGGITTFITPDTYFTTLTKEPLRKMILDRDLIKLVQLGHDVFESAMVSTAILIVANKVGDGASQIECVDVKNHDSIYDADIYKISQLDMKHSINGVFYMPTPFNRTIDEKLAEIHTTLVNDYFSKVSTSREIERNANWLKTYRNSLNPGDWTLIGLVTEGGQGLATANNGRFIGVKGTTKDAIRIRQTRIEKLDELNRLHKTDYTLPDDEVEIWNLFEDLKKKYGRDVFGQGYLYRIVPDDLIADVESITDDEKRNGISGSRTYVPYDKGDKEGNRWYYETPYLIDWCRDNVTFLKENSGKKGQGMPVVRNAQFYFREGFCYSDIKTFFLKAKMKGVSIHDVKSMSLFPVCDAVPYYYLISLLNTEITATFVYNFLNNTPSFQMNDCRMLPIPIPTDSQLNECKALFDKAASIQKRYFAKEITSDDRDDELESVQSEIDYWACRLYGFDVELLKGSKNIVR